MRENPDMLIWFSKPEKAMNKRLNEHLGKQQLKEKRLKERIETFKDKLTQYQRNLQVRLQSVIEVISGMPIPLIFRRGHTRSEKPLNDFVSNGERGSAQRHGCELDSEAQNTRQ